MSIFNKVITKVFGKKSDKDLKKIEPFINQINSKYNKIKDLGDQELKDKFNKIRLNLQNTINDTKNNLQDQNIKSIDIDKNIKTIEIEYLNEHMVEVFAIVKDVARRLGGTKFKVMDTDMIWEMVHENLLNDQYQLILFHVDDVYDDDVYLIHQ